MVTKTIELTGYSFGTDEDHAAEIVWHVIRTCREKKLNAREVTVARASLRVVLDVTGTGYGVDGQMEAAGAWLKAATAHLVSAVSIGAAAGRMRGEGALVTKVLDV